MVSIETAIPTNQEVIQYLELNYNYAKDEAISAIIARKVSENLHTDTFKRDFKCPTKNCPALITCRSLSPNSANKETFVDSIRKINQHIDTCQYSNKQLLLHGNNNADSHSKYINTGNLESDISLNLGFAHTLKHKPTTSNIDIIPGSKPTKGEHNPSNTSETAAMKVVSHLKSLQEHVDLFQTNPNKLIKLPGEDIIEPIKTMFKPIESNKLFNRNKNRLYIYYGSAFINNIRTNPKLRQIKFIKNVTIDNKQYKPTFIVSAEVLEQEYPDIMSVYNQKETTLFVVYIVLPFILNKKFLNFSSYFDSKTLSPYSKELLASFYISPRGKVHNL